MRSTGLLQRAKQILHEEGMLSFSKRGVLFFASLTKMSLTKMLGKRHRFFVRDVYYTLRYGMGAPKYQQQIWINPGHCITWCLRGLGQEYSGAVLDGDWDLETAEIYECPPIRFCLLHWVDGVPWDKTGAYEHMMSRIREFGEFDGCATWQDVVCRYQRLDEIYNEIKEQGRLLTSSELGKTRRRNRECDGVLVHIGRHGPIFSGYACHRFAMALALAIPQIPVQLGAIHPKALDKLKDYTGERLHR